MLDTRMSAAKERWLAELYQAHSNTVLRLCWRLLSNPQDAADACQEVFLRAAGSLDPDAPRDRAKAWLLTVARNYCLDQLRRQKHLSSALTTMAREAYCPADPESTVVDRQLVNDIMNQLNERERRALWQTAVEHRTLADVASHLGLNYMAAGQVVSRARRHALMLAAKVAAVFLVFRFIARRTAVLPAKLVAATAIPVFVLTLQPSSSSTSTFRPPAPVSTKQSGSLTAPSWSTSVRGAQSQPAGEGISVLVAPLQIGASTLPVPSSVAGPAGSATGILNSILHQLPTPPPVATPSLPPPPGLK